MVRPPVLLHFHRNQQVTNDKTNCCPEGSLVLRLPCSLTLFGLLDDVDDVGHQRLSLRRRRRAHQHHEPGICYLGDVVVGHGVLKVTSMPEPPSATLTDLIMITTTTFL